jgi:predicted peptidase
MNARRSLVSIGLVLAATSTMSAQDAIKSTAVDPAAVYEARVFQADDGELKYRLLKPLDYDPQQKYPLVLFLHGAGERGDDNQAQLVHGCRDLADEALRRRHPAFVVVPQCPNDKKWVEVPWDRRAHKLPEDPGPTMHRVFALVEALEKEFSIDGARRYGVGLSMGGYGVWDILSRRPDLLAAAVPVCGGGDPAYAEKFKATPVWAFHGGADPVVVPERSREMIAALAAAGGRPIYTEYEGVPHDSWSPTFANRTVWDWLFAQRR